MFKLLTTLTGLKLSDVNLEEHDEKDEEEEPEDFGSEQVPNKTSDQASDEKEVCINRFVNFTIFILTIVSMYLPSQF